MNWRTRNALVRWGRGLVAVIVLATAINLGWQTHKFVDWRNATAGERTVAAIPGIGSGWIDTLRRVAGPAEVAVLTNRQIAEFQGGSLAGIYEQWYDRVRINTDLRGYFRALKGTCENQPQGFFGHRYRHPPELWNPGAVIAHEFGHRFQDRVLSETNLPWKNLDGEYFADQFAIAMLQIRGWIARDTSNAQLFNYLSYRLRSSYWRDE